MEERLDWEREMIRFRKCLTEEEKSRATIEKYIRDVRTFQRYLENRDISKKETIAYKEYLTKKYAPSSVNSMLVALNRFLNFAGFQDACVHLLKIQRQMFINEDRELSKQEYQCLVREAKQSRLSYVIQTICGTGIRVSELQYITVEALNVGKAVVACKSKTRVIFIPTQIRRMLREYVRKKD